MQTGKTERLAGRDRRFRQIDDAVLVVLGDEHLLAVGGDFVPADIAEARLLFRAEIEEVDVIASLLIELDAGANVPNTDREAFAAGIEGKAVRIVIRFQVERVRQAAVKRPQFHAIDLLVGSELFASGRDRGPVPFSYQDYLSLKARQNVFEWSGAAQISQTAIESDGRSVIATVASVTPEIAALFHLPLEQGVVLGHSFWQNELREAALEGRQIVTAGTAVSVAGIAPESLEGLYAGRPVDGSRRAQSWPVRSFYG